MVRKDLLERGDKEAREDEVKMSSGGRTFQTVGTAKAKFLG